MSIFAEILCKLFPTVKFPTVNNNSIYELNNSYSHNKLYYNAVKLIYNIYFLPFNKNYNGVNNNKFNILNIIILNNKNINKFHKHFFLIQFYKAQKTYSAFRKLAILYKFKHGQQFEIDTDLCFNNFTKLNKSILISIFENNILYKFRISDLVNIINKSLSNAPNFFAEPSEIRNPYTNLPITLANLYNIYFKLKNSNYIMPLLFHQYFISNFDLNIFKNENECIIRDKSIDNFVKTDSIDEQYEYIMKMFYTYHNFIYFTLHPFFPKKKLVNIFKKYLKPFLLREYSLNPFIREKYNIDLQYKLALFSQLNPDFGKKIYKKTSRNNINNLHYTFNETVIESSNLIYDYPTNIPDYLNRTEISQLLETTDQVIDYVSDQDTDDDSTDNSIDDADQ